MDLVEMGSAVTALKAAGESTRLRILAVLDRNELTVGELCRVLGQSQPRVSRHLKLLVDAGLLERHAEGASAFFRPCLDGAPRCLYDTILTVVDPLDPVRQADAERLESVRADRAEAAAAYFESVAPDWDRIRATHVSDETVEKALAEAVAERPVDTLLDVGTGTGRILEVLAPHVRRGVGLDLSREMLHLARTRMDRAGLMHCTVRHGDAYCLDTAPDSVDVAVLHHVLHFLDRPGEAISEVGRVLRPGGLLLVVDFAPHQVEHLRVEYAHRRLGFGDSEVRSLCGEAGLRVERTTHFEPGTADETGPAEAKQQLTVTLWEARRSNAPSAPVQAPEVPS
jgi:ubiquinone/menaquinone biosynthesis C-methylase UbiE